jgi:Flp pilus assembly pilin Flp
MLDCINSLIARAMLTAQGGIKREEGQALTEYALVLAVIVIGIVASMTALKTGIGNKITSIVSSISSAN